jgi:AraC family transcriptional activator of pobA
MTMENAIVEERVRIFGGDYIPPDMKVLLQLEDLIDRHFKEIKSTEFYAAQLNMSYFKLNEISMLYRGKTVYELWQTRFFAEAEKLLKYTGLSVKQIAQELNCCDQAYFSNCFKRWKGVRPKEFRRRLPRRSSSQ